MRSFLIISAVWLGGCSALFVEHPDDHWAPPGAPRCSESRAPVGIDVLTGIAAGVGGLVAVGQGEPGVGSLAVLGGAAFIGSAIHGSRVVSKCAEQREAYEAFLSDRQQRPGGAGESAAAGPRPDPEGAERAGAEPKTAGEASAPGEKVPEGGEPALEPAGSDRAAGEPGEPAAGEPGGDEASPAADAEPDESAARAGTAKRRAPAADADVFWSERPEAPPGRKVVRGVVVHLENQEMYFNLGEGDQVKAGDPVRVKHPVKLEAAGGAKAVEDWLPVGAARVSQVGSQLTMARLDAELAGQVERGDVVEVLVRSDEPAPAEAPPKTAAKPANEKPLPQVDDETSSLLEVVSAVADRPAAVRAAAWERFLSTHPESSYAGRIREEIALLHRQMPDRDRGSAEPEGPSIGGLDHRHPETVQPDRPLDLVFVASDPDDLLAARLYYRHAGEATYHRGTLSREGELYLRGTVPAEEVRGGAVQYFVEVVSKEDGVGFAAGSPKRPVAVEVEEPALSEAFEEQRNRSRVSASTLYLDYATFDDRAGDRSDNVFLFETDFFYRLYRALYGVRAGFGVLRGEGGFADSTDPQEVGFNYGYSELELRGPRQLSLIGRLIAGVGDQGFGLGFAGRVRLGPEDGTNLSLGVENLDEIGFLSDIRMQWAALEQFPIGLTAAVTDQPTGGDLGVRLTTSLGWRAISWFQPTLFVSYQGRSVVHSGVGGGLGLVFDW